VPARTRCLAAREHSVACEWYEARHLRPPEQLFTKFVSFPAIGHTEFGVRFTNKRSVAFLDASQIIEREVLDDVYGRSRGWQPIGTFFDAEPETPNVLLGDGEVRLGLYDADCEYWRLDGHCAEDEPIEPTK
jgi:hypothetical protein